MLSNKRGVALLQVLIVVAILGGMVAMILRVTMSRTVTARQTYRTAAGQMLIESCMAEVNQIWTSKTPEAYARDLENCNMYCAGVTNDTCVKFHTCNQQAVYPLNTNSSVAYNVLASMDTSTSGRCKVVYRLQPAAGGTAL